MAVEQSGSSLLARASKSDLPEGFDGLLVDIVCTRSILGAFPDRFWRERSPVFIKHMYLGLLSDLRKLLDKTDPKGKSIITIVRWYDKNKNFLDEIEINAKERDIICKELSGNGVFLRKIQADCHQLSGHNNRAATGVFCLSNIDLSIRILVRSWHLINIFYANHPLRPFLKFSEKTYPNRGFEKTELTDIKDKYNTYIKAVINWREIPLTEEKYNDIVEAAKYSSKEKGRGR